VLAILANGDRQRLELSLQALPRFTVQEGASGQVFDLGIPQSAVDEAVNRTR
jgi:hypothetical protein